MRYGPRGNLDAPRGDRIHAAVRAARAFADLSQPELASALEALGLGASASTLARWEGSPPASAPGPEYIAAFAEICGVPLWFFERGFEGLEELDDQRQSVAQLAAQVRDLAERMARAESALSARDAAGVAEALAPDQGDERSTRTG